jgi:hypothetical protein
MEDIQLLQYQDMNLYLSSYPQITFIRNIYRRYSNFVSKHTTYNNYSIENNKQIFKIYLVDDMTRIQNIYLSVKSIDNIKQINMYCCKNQIDNDDYMSRSLLHSYNHFFLHNINCILNSRYIVLPFNDTLYGTTINSYNYHIEYEIEYINHVFVNIDSIIINYLSSKNFYEITNFNSIVGEAVFVKQCKYIEYNVEKGANNILLNVYNLACGILFFNFDTNNDINGTLFTDNISCPSFEVNRLLSQLQYGRSILPANTYIVDTGNNMFNFIKGDLQPHGHLTFNKDSRFIFNSEAKCKLYITYIYYDMLCFDNTINSSIYLLGNRPNQMDIPPVLESYPVPIPITINIPAQPPQPPQPPFYLYNNILKKYEQSIAIAFDNDIENCVISHDEIKPNDYFYICSTCNKPCKFNELKEWLDINSSCPHCRVQYAIYPLLYIKK